MDIPDGYYLVAIEGPKGPKEPGDVEGYSVIKEYLNVKTGHIIRRKVYKM